MLAERALKTRGRHQVTKEEAENDPSLLHPIFLSVVGDERTFFISTADNDLYHMGENLSKLYVLTKSKAPGLQRLIRPRQMIADICFDNKKCFYTSKDGILYGWGDNTWFELNSAGNETKNRVVKLTYKIEEVQPSQDNKDPFQVTSGATFRMARTCNDCSFLLTTKGLYSIGNKTTGLLGYKPPPEVIVHPKRVDFGGLEPSSKIVGISVSRHHVLAWTNTGRSYAWGYNYNGVLGIENNRRRQDKLIVHPQPVKVLENTIVTSLEACDTCSFAINYRGKLYYWGRYISVM